MNPVRFQPRAEADAEEAATWYERQRPGLGAEFTLELDAAIAKVAQNPEAYRQQYRELR